VNFCFHNINVRHGDRGPTSNTVNAVGGTMLGNRYRLGWGIVCSDDHGGLDAIDAVRSGAHSTIRRYPHLRNSSGRRHLLDLLLKSNLRAVDPLRRVGGRWLREEVGEGWVNGAKSATGIATMYRGRDTKAEGNKHELSPIVCDDGQRVVCHQTCLIGVGKKGHCMAEISSTNIWLTFEDLQNRKPYFVWYSSTSTRSCSS
jgi:hypothetical protein